MEKSLKWTALPRITNPGSYNDRKEKYEEGINSTKNICDPNDNWK